MTHTTHPHDTQWHTQHILTTCNGTLNTSRHAITHSTPYDRQWHTQHLTSRNGTLITLRYAMAHSTPHDTQWHTQHLTTRNDTLNTSSRQAMNTQHILTSRNEHATHPHATQYHTQHIFMTCNDTRNASSRHTMTHATHPNDTQ